MLFGSCRFSVFCFNVRTHDDVKDFPRKVPSLAPHVMVYFCIPRTEPGAPDPQDPVQNSNS